MAITSKELREGNIVSFKGQPKHLSILDIYAISGDNEPDIWDGIPLSPSILESCGWKWNEECDSYEKYPNGDARMNLQFREVSGSYSMFNYVLRSKIADRIYYLHQLQNLYFALTGTEITFNPSTIK